MKHSFNSDHIRTAVQILRQGGVVIFPTDTVWGIGALLSSPQGVEKFYTIKEREPSKPSQVLVSNFTIAQRYGVFNTQSTQLAEQYWPGALTMIVHANEDQVPESSRAGRSNVGLRVPDHQLCLNLLNQLGEGLIASSANRSGGHAPTTYDTIDPSLLAEVDYVLPGEAGNAPSSTVLDTTQQPMVVIRQGAVKVVL